MQGNRSHYRVLMSAGRRADVVSLRSRGPIKGLMPQRQCGGGGWFSTRWRGRGWIGKQQTTIPHAILRATLCPASPRLALPRLAQYLTRYEQRLRAGPCLFCLCVGAGLGGVARLMGETPAHPAAPAPARPRHAQPSLARPTVPCQLPRQRSTWLKHGFAFLR